MFVVKMNICAGLAQKKRTHIPSVHAYSFRTNMVGEGLAPPASMDKIQRKAGGAKPLPYRCDADKMCRT